MDMLSFPDNLFIERYHFSSQLRQYLCDLIDPDKEHVSCHGHASRAAFCVTLVMQSTLVRPLRAEQSGKFALL